MIFCVTQPIDRYVEHLPRGQLGGLFVSYGHTPELFNLITRVTTIPFMYEPEFDGFPVGSRIQVINHDHHLSNTLPQEVDGVTVSSILKIYDPEQMYQLFIEKKPKHLEVVNLYGEWELLLYVMQLRVLQFKKYYRGKLKQGKNISRVQFKSSLTTAEDKTLLGAVAQLKKESEKKL
jgi:hypothetical protein